MLEVDLAKSSVREVLGRSLPSNVEEEDQLVPPLRMFRQYFSYHSAYICHVVVRKVESDERFILDQGLLDFYQVFF